MNELGGGGSAPKVKPARPVTPTKPAVNVKKSNPVNRNSPNYVAASSNPKNTNPVNAASPNYIGDSGDATPLASIAARALVQNPPSRFAPIVRGSGREVEASLAPEVVEGPSPTAGRGVESITTAPNAGRGVESFQTISGLDTAGLVGPEMVKSGLAGTFGQFERQRRARGPSTGLSMTPEELQRTAARRLG